jgi:very-short-patch-repair endonuclease
MQNSKLVEECELILKEGFMSKSEFKKKYSYKYKLLLKFKLIDVVFANYNNNLLRDKKLQEYMKPQEVIDFCKTIKKSEINNKTRRLLKFYNLDINKIEFKPRKQQCKYSDEFLKELTSKYIFEFELMTKNYDVYKFCKNKKILKRFNLIKNNISLPQLMCKYIIDILLKEKGELNNRELIKPKEVDIFYKKHNLCIEYDGLYWHRNRLSEDILKEQEILKNGYNFIKIKEESKDYEADIKNKLIDNLTLLNKISKFKISKSDILNIKVDKCNMFDLDVDQIKHKLLFYKSKDDFIKSENTIFLQLQKLGMKNIITDFYKKLDLSQLEKINVYDISKKFNNITQFKNKDNKLYKYILSEKKDILDELKLCNLKYFNDIKKYNSLYDIKRDSNLYQIALKYKRKNIISTKYYSIENLEYFVETKSYFELIKNKTFIRFIKDDGNLEYLIEKFKEKDFNKYFSLNLNIEEIKKLSIKYPNIKSFSKDYPKIIKYIRNNNLIDVVFSHINTLKFKNNIVKKEKYIIKMS